MNNFFRLFYHECLRVFHDRLINTEDKNYFHHLLGDICSRTFEEEIIPLRGDEGVTQPPLILFGDFMTFGAPKEQRFYEEITDLKKATNILQVFLFISFVLSVNGFFKIYFCFSVFFLFFLSLLFLSLFILYSFY